MIPEFIAWDKDKNKWISWAEGYVIAFNGKIYDRGLVTSKRIDLYQYINRKDKDGNKVYEGSLIQVPICNYVYRIVYNKEACRYVGRRFFNKEKLSQREWIEASEVLYFTSRSLFSVIGHIAEEK